LLIVKQIAWYISRKIKHNDLIYLIEVKKVIKI